MVGANLSLYVVNAIIVLGPSAERVFAHYYESPHALPQGQHVHPSAFPAVKDQKAFEKGLFDKTRKTNHEVILYDNRIIVYKQSVDCMIYAVGGLEENELMLMGVVSAIKDAMELAIKSTIDKRTLLENYDMFTICVDEVVDDGIIIETDANIVASRVSGRPQEDSIANAYEKAKQGFAERIFSAF